MNKLFMIAFTTLLLSACGAEEGLTQAEEDTQVSEEQANEESTSDESTEEESTTAEDDSESEDDASNEDDSTEQGDVSDEDDSSGNDDTTEEDDAADNDSSNEDDATGEDDAAEEDDATGEDEGDVSGDDDATAEDDAAEEEQVVDAQICTTGSQLGDIPANYVAALEKYTTTNSEYTVYVCTQDTNNDGEADYMVVESTNQPEHESYYFEDDNHHHEDFDFDTNKYKYDAVYDSQRTGAAGNNMIEAQTVIMKMPITPSAAATKTNTPYGTIGLAINGVSFFNENAAPGDDITEELFTFDQCSGHPQGSGLYHYHVDPVCLIRDLGGEVTTATHTEGGKTYSWIEDTGTNAGLLVGFLVDGFPVYGPVGNSETDCNAEAVSSDTIDGYNGHSHCTAEFSEAIYHYHVKTAEVGATGESVFWVTNTQYYGEPGVLSR